MTTRAGPAGPGPTPRTPTTPAGPGSPTRAGPPPRRRCGPRTTRAGRDGRRRPGGPPSGRPTSASPAGRGQPGPRRASGSERADGDLGRGAQQPVDLVVQLAQGQRGAGHVERGAVLADVVAADVDPALGQLLM